MTDRADSKSTDDGPTQGVHLLPNGMIRLQIEDRRIMLRRPTIGEVRTIREAIRQVNDDVSDRAVKVQAEANAIRQEREQLDADYNEAVEGLSGDDRVEAANAHAAKVNELRAADRKLMRDLDDYREELTVGWVVDAVNMLSMDDQLDDDENLPAWVLDGQLPGKLLNHWRTVPLAPGG